MSTVLAFDFGEKRIGVAVGETLLAQAHPLTVIATGDRELRWKSIAALVTEWQPARLIVGLPTHADGTPHALTERCKRFAESLRRRHPLPVGFADERLSSRDAEARLRDTGHNARSSKAVLDAVAAQIILQTWFESNTHDTPPSA